MRDIHPYFVQDRKDVSLRLLCRMWNTCGHSAVGMILNPFCETYQRAQGCEVLERRSSTYVLKGERARPIDPIKVPQYERP